MRAREQMTEPDALILDLSLALIGKFPRDDVPKLLGHALVWLRRRDPREHRIKPFTLIAGGRP